MVDYAQWVCMRLTIDTLFSYPAGCVGGAGWVCKRAGVDAIIPYSARCMSGAKGVCIRAGIDVVSAMIPAWTTRVAKRIFVATHTCKGWIDRK